MIEAHDAPHRTTRPALTRPVSAHVTGRRVFPATSVAGIGRSSRGPEDSNQAQEAVGEPEASRADVAPGEGVQQSAG